MFVWYFLRGNGTNIDAVPVEYLVVLESEWEVYLLARSIEESIVWHHLLQRLADRSIP
jgi:hypothetical protein